MLSLTFPGRWGLLIFCLPTYRRKRKTPPLLACHPIDRDLLDDARRLLDEGHTIAAAMTVRVEIERQLTKLALAHPSFGHYWQGVCDTANWLRNRHVIKARLLSCVLRANDCGNKAAHGRPVTSAEVDEMISAGFNLRDLIANKWPQLAEGGAA